MQVNWWSTIKNNKSMGSSHWELLITMSFENVRYTGKFSCYRAYIIEKLQLHLKWTLSRALFVEFTKTN